MKHQLSLIFRKFQLKTFVLPILFTAAVTVIACSNMFNDIYDGSRLRVGIFLNSFGSGCKLFTLDSEGKFIDISDKLPALPLNTVASTILDYDKDGFADITVVDTTGLTLLRGNGDGSFRINFYENLGLGAPQDICYDDFNSDGKLDFAIADNSATIYTRGMPPVLYAAPGNPRAIEKGDINGDGKTDLFTSSSDNIADNDTILLNNSTSNFAFIPSQHTTGLDYGYGEARLFDIDNNGITDLIRVGENFIRIYKNDGNANFTETQNINILNVETITTGDLDGDGDIDAFIGNSVGPAGSIINNGNGVFTYKAVFMLFKSVLFDIDFDNDLDVIGYSGASLYILKNDGRGNFSLHSTASAGITPNDINLFTYHAED